MTPRKCKYGGDKIEINRRVIEPAWYLENTCNTCEAQIKIHNILKARPDLKERWKRDHAI